MKKTYITPEIKVTSTVVESALLQESGTLQGFSKKHDIFFDSWNDDNEESEAMFQQPKSLWDD